MKLCQFSRHQFSAGIYPAVSLAILWALLSPDAPIVSAREYGPVWYQAMDRRPRVDSSWAIVKRDTLEIGVEHNGGIGKTDFVLKHGQWPPKLRLVFHNFKALEGIKISTASDKFEGAIGVSNNKPAIALDQGFTAKRKGDLIYIYGPSRFIKKNDKSIHVEWVDFYRH